MSKQNIKLVASDLDGTLLKNEIRSLPPGTCDRIKRLKELGVFFVAASGRPYTNLKRLFKEVENDIAFISDNGALCTYQGKALTRKALPKDIGDMVIDFIHEYPGSQCMVSGEKLSYTDSKDKDFIHMIRNVADYDLEIVDNLKTDIAEPYLKVSGYALSGSKKLEQFLQEKLQGITKVVTSGNNWLDCMPEGCSKATALQKVLDEIGLEPKNCMAFGDQYNDVEMLQLAEISYAMNDAAPGISYYSTDITDSVIDVLDDLIAQKIIEEQYK